MTHGTDPRTKLKRSICSKSFKNSKIAPLGSSQFDYYAHSHSTIRARPNKCPLKKKKGNE